MGSVLGFFQERYPEALGHFDESYRINTALGARGNAGYDLVSRSSTLWSVGRYQEAEAALTEAYAIAQNPETADKYLMAWVCLFKARMALSQGRLEVAKARGRQALELAEAQFKDIAVQAQYTLGLAEALGGRPGRGKALGEAAMAEAAGLHNPRYAAEAGLALAEVLLIGGEFQQALEQATVAQSTFMRFGQPASEWQALIIAAQAASRQGDQPGANHYAARALELLPMLEQRWGAAAYQGFLTRPDVRRHRQQLDQWLAANQ
jgi:tetratricopeptide (TPR) repeat protein